jgi:hypothetical protein
MRHDSIQQDIKSLHRAEENDQRERRIELLIQRLPSRIQRWVRWLRHPSRRWARVSAGLLLIVGGLLSLLPLLGLWMLPVGLLLISEDVPFLRHASNDVLKWIERRHPHWMGLSPQKPLLQSPTERHES